MKNKIFKVEDVSSFHYCQIKIDNVIVVSPSVVQRYTLAKYNNRYFVGLESEDTDEAFNNLFALFKDTYANTIDMIYKSFQERYSPVFNVDITETTEYGRRHSKDDFGQVETDFAMQTRTDNLNKNGVTDTTLNFENSIESQDYIKDGKVETTSGQITNEYGSHTDTTTQKSYSNESTDDSYTDTITRKGNQGVTYAIDGITKELDGRQTDFIPYILDLFYDKYTFLGVI